MKTYRFRLEDTDEYQTFLQQQQETSPEAAQALLPSPDDRQAVVNPQGVYEPLEPIRFYSGAVGDTALLNQPLLRGMEAARRGLGAGADLASQVFLEPMVDLSTPMQASMQARGVQSQMPKIAPDVMASMSPGLQASYQAMEAITDPSQLVPTAVSMSEVEPTPFEAAMTMTGVGIPVAGMSKLFRSGADLLSGAKRFGTVMNVVKDANPAAATRMRNLLMGDKKLQEAVSYLTPDEILKLASTGDANARRNLDTMNEFLTFAPESKILQAAAKVGRSKQGWYENSRNTIEHVFGDDAGLFAGILAATSPQTSVESNMQNALSFYNNWVKAGRPTSEARVNQLLAQSVQGSKGEESVLQAWRNNVLEVVKGGQTISGPKVDSFWTNLRSRPRTMTYSEVGPDEAVTLDAWMAALFGMNKDTFSGAGKNLAKADPGFSPNYLAGTALTRKTARELGITPAEVQETTWSFAKALYEKAKNVGMTPEEVLKKNLLSDEEIAGTVDFALLMQQPQYAGLLKDVPTATARLSTMPKGRKPTLSALDPSEQKAAAEAARVLGRVLLDRQRATAMKTGRDLGQQAVMQATMEVTPSLREPWTLSESQGQKVMAAAEDLAGRNLVQEAVSGRAIPVQRGIGDYAGANAPVASAGMVADVRGQRVQPRDVVAQDISNILHATAYGQEAMGTTALRFNTKGPKDAMRFTTPVQMTPAKIQQIKTLLGEGWVVNTRADGLDVFWAGGTPMELTEPMQQQLRDAVQQASNDLVAAKSKKPVKNFPKVQGKAGVNLAAQTPSQAFPGQMMGYVEMPLRDPATRAQTQRLAQALVNASPAQVRRLDSPPVRLWAKKTRDAYKNVEGYPPELQNYLRLIEEGGVSRLMQALQDPNIALPALAAVGITPSLMDTWLGTTQE